MARVDTKQTAADRIVSVRTTLTEYVRALHRPHGALCISPFEAYGALGRVHAAPSINPMGLLELCPVQNLIKPLGRSQTSPLLQQTLAFQTGIPGVTLKKPSYPRTT